MAVFTAVGAEDMAALVSRYDVGTLVSAKGIAEGVQNSNFLVETTGSDGHGARFILTIYESRTETAELPFFLSLLAHLKARGCAVPAFIADRGGHTLQQVEGKPACLIEFLTGISVTKPTLAQARAAGAALGVMHRALDDFPGQRANDLGQSRWQAMAEAAGTAGLDGIAPGLGDRIAHELADLSAQWPHDLPTSAIHADLFPDNVLMLGDRVTGLIDFYFAATDIRAYDIAVTHAAWCFSADGKHFNAELSAALLGGYEAEHSIAADERAALPLLARGAAMRFLLTRAYDWINTPADALVTRKDPLAFLRRLDFYCDPANAAVFERVGGVLAA